MTEPKRTRYPSYKESGAAWLGDIPANWNVVKLKRIALLRSAGITSEQISEDGDYPVYGGGGLRGYTHSYTHEGHFPLIGRQGALCGNVTCAKGKFWASEHAVVVKPLTGAHPVWLGELLRAMNLNQYSVSAAQPGLATDTIRELPIPWPPLETQRAIANFLDRKTRAIDELIRKKERLIELLQEKRQVLITQAVTKGLDPNVPMKDSGVPWLGEIPAKRLFQEIDRRLGETEPPPLLSVSIHHGVRERSDLTDRESRADNFVGYKLCEAGDIVINRMRAFQGAIGISPMRGIVSPDYAVLRMNVSVSARYFHHLFRSSWLVGEITARLRGIGSSELGNVRTPRINIPDLGEIRLDLPTLPEQRAIADFLDQKTQSINELIGKNARLIERLREYRQALISAAVTGQIDVTEDAAFATREAPVHDVQTA